MLKDIITREDGAVSMVRVMACVLLAFLLAVYTYALVSGKTLPYFTELLAFTSSVIFATLGSKYLDIKKEVQK